MLDATPRKRWLGFDFKFKNFSIKQAIFMKDIFPSRLKAPTQEKFKVFFQAFLSKFEIFKTFSNNKISNFVFDTIFFTSIIQL